MLRNGMVAIITLLLSVNMVLAATHLYPEKSYQEAWCKNNGGQTEIILNDNSRVDCLLPDYAIEFDFANKWPEAVGQSLYYSYMTKKKAGIVLIIENGYKDNKYLNRLLKIANIYNIKVWTIYPNYLQKICK